jgi:hypothetical protein
MGMELYKRKDTRNNPSVVVESITEDNNNLSSTQCDQIYEEDEG